MNEFFHSQTTQTSRFTSSLRLKAIPSLETPTSNLVHNRSRLQCDAASWETNVRFSCIFGSIGYRHFNQKLSYYATKPWGRTLWTPDSAGPWTRIRWQMSSRWPPRLAPKCSHCHRRTLTTCARRCWSSRSADIMWFITKTYFKAIFHPPWSSPSLYRWNRSGAAGCWSRTRWQD